MQKECPHGLTAAIACKGCATDIDSLRSKLAAAEDALARKTEEMKVVARAYADAPKAVEAALTAAERENAELRKPHEAFLAGYKKNWDDAMENHRKLFQANSSLSIRVEQAEAALATERAEAKVLYAASQAALAAVTRERDDIKKGVRRLFDRMPEIAMMAPELRKFNE